MSRLTVRFAPAYDAWIAALGTEQADAVRALMVLGAAALGLPGAEQEARRLVEASFRADVEDALFVLADTRQTHGRHMADTRQTPPAEMPAGLGVDDPFASIGIEV